MISFFLPSSKEDLPKGAIILGCVAAGLLLLAIVIAFLVLRSRKEKKKKEAIREDTELARISTSLLELLSNIKLGEILDEGSFGKVYKGNWNETNVALKQLKDESDKKFQREVSLLW